MSNMKNRALAVDVRTSWDASSVSFGIAQTRLFYVVWYAINVLLIGSLFFAIYAVTWEISTRRYLKGFSDAIVPATAPGDEKVQAVLNWMAHGPARMPSGPSPYIPDRDPTDTLNYDALLQVCGTATNAFINLLDTGKVEVRRLLLLDENQNTKHVVAEVLVGDRWIIVDPAYRTVLRDSNGDTVTREQLMNPATYVEVTSKIPHYDPTYTFDHTAHVRVARFHILGLPVREFLNHVFPGWEDSTSMTLLVERESYAATVAAFLLIVLLILTRYLLRWFGEKRLQLRLLRVRSQILRSVSAFFKA
jgi:hypothetical protein